MYWFLATMALSGLNGGPGTPVTAMKVETQIPAVILTVTPGIILETIPEAERMSLRSLWNRRFPQNPQNHKYLSSKPRGAPVFSGALGHFLF